MIRIVLLYFLQQCLPFGLVFSSSLLSELLQSSCNFSVSCLFFYKPLWLWWDFLFGLHKSTIQILQLKYQFIFIYLSAYQIVRPQLLIYQYSKLTQGQVMNQSRINMEMCTFCLRLTQKLSLLQVCCDPEDFVCFDCTSNNSHYNPHYICAECDQPLGQQYKINVESVKRIMNGSNSSNDTQQKEIVNIPRLNVQFTNSINLKENLSGTRNRNDVEKLQRFRSTSSLQAKDKDPNQMDQEFEQKYSGSPISKSQRGLRVKFLKKPE